MELDRELEIEVEDEMDIVVELQLGLEGGALMLGFDAVALELAI